MEIDSFERLKESFYFVNNPQNLENIFKIIDEMSEKRPRFKFLNIQTDENYIKLLFFKNMKIKKERKNLVGVDREIIREFNETLKSTYKMPWCQHFHNKDNWINQILTIIKNKSVSLLNEIKIYSGVNEYEENRLWVDYNIVKNYSWSPFFPSDDFKEKINCICKKDLIETNPEHSLLNRTYFKIGGEYKFRVNKENSYRHVYYDEYYDLIFENNTFYEYFYTKEEMRESKINQILS